MATTAPPPARAEDKQWFALAGEAVAAVVLTEIRKFVLRRRETETSARLGEV
jgi:hypothetical protein